MKSVDFSQINNYDESYIARFLILAKILLFLSLNTWGQGSGCVNGPTVNLGLSGGSTCSLQPVTISGTFGGSATNITITENGNGSVSPALITATPFVFTYTPKNKDKGKTVTITVTTNNPLGSPCEATKATVILAIGSGLSAPVIGTVTNTSCLKQTGSVVLSGLPSSGTWMITCNPGGLTTSGTGTSTTISDLEAGTYTFIVTNALGCSSAPSRDVVINLSSTIPSAPSVDTIIAPSCQSSTGSVILNGLPSIGTWILTRYPGTVTSTGTGVSTAVTGLYSGTYNFTVTNSEGCSSGLSANVVIPAPTGSVNMVITNPPAVCSPSTVNLTSSVITAGSPSGMIFTYWTNAEATIPYTIPSAATEGTYYIKGTMGTGCFDIKPVTVTIGILAEANAGTGGHICGLDFTFNAILTAGNGTWAKISGPGNVVFTPDNNQPNSNVSVDQAGTYDFAWNVDNNSCISRDIVRVIFHEPPSIDIGTSSDTTICKGANIQLHAMGAGFFSWSPAELFINPNIADPVATPVASTTLTVKLTDQFGCENSADFKVNLQDKPVANAGPDQILTSTTDTKMNAALYNNNDKGVWSLISGTGELFDSTYAKTSLSGLSPNQNEFVWTVTNGVCPESSDTVRIIVRGMVIPTLITPNMDGKNDYFVLRGFDGDSNIELVIFDRRGVEVYKNGNYNNEWNGIDYNENPLPDDTYFYIIKAKSNKSISGYIVVRR